MDDLPQAQRKQLQHFIAKLEGVGRSFLAPHSKTLGAILRWAEANYLLPAQMTAQRDVTVTWEWLEAVDRALTSQGFAPLQSTRGGDRITQAGYSRQEVKHLAEAPTLHRLLMAHPTPTQADNDSARQGASWMIEDADWRAIDLRAYAVLIAVENLTVFYQLHSLRIAWPARALIVYRGHQLYHRGFSQLLQSWAETAQPCYAMVDLDPFSIRMLQQGPYTHVAAPAFERFELLANPGHAPSKQQSYASKLQAQGGFAPYIALMQQRQCGLKQEWMHTEPLYWVELS